jgi:hypothetical protein
LILRLAPLLILAGAIQPARAAAPGAATIVVHIRTEPTGPALNGTVLLKPLIGGQPSQSLPFTSTDPLQFSVPADTSWQVTATAKGWWAAPRIATTQPEQRDVTLELLPAAHVTGQLATTGDSHLPEAVDVLIDIPPNPARKTPPTGAGACSVLDRGRFDCEVPPGVVDLTFRARGFVPVYRWSVAAAAGAPADVGTLTLSTGSSVTGFIALTGAPLVSGRGKVSLYRPGGAGATAARLARPVGEAVVGPKGFFTIGDVPPGRYALQATYPGFAPATVRAVDVVPHVECRIRRAVELQRPQTLTLRTDPPSDPHGHDWLVVVSHASAVTSQYDAPPIWNGRAEGGVVILNAEAGGRYRVMVADASGDVFQNAEFTTAGLTSEVHVVTVHFVRVTGTVRRGDAPIAATLWFGGRHGERHVVARSDNDGKFETSLPSAGKWRVQVKTAHGECVVSSDIAARDDGLPASADIALPGATLSGTVVDQNDRPVERASVSLATHDSLVAQIQQTDSTGRFAFDGIPSGLFTAVAESYSGGHTRRSPRYESSMADGTASEDVVLKLGETQSVHGRVMSSDGAVIGARVSVYAPEVTAISSFSSATTDTAGVFDAAVASECNRVLIEVHAAGFALRVFNVPLDGRAFTLNLPQAGGALAVIAPKDVATVLLFQDDRLLPLSSLFEWSQSQGEPLLDGGILRVHDIAPGRYRACAILQDMAALDSRHCAEGFLAPYGELTLTIP